MTLDLVERGFLKRDTAIRLMTAHVALVEAAENVTSLGEEGSLVDKDIGDALVAIHRAIQELKNR